MRRIGALVLCFAMGSLALAGEAQADEAGAGDCVGFSKTDVEKGFEYAINNACSRKLSCNVSWTVTCETNDGRVTSKKRESAKLAIDGDGSGSVTASAAACKQGWSIDDVGWHCSEAK